MKRTVPVCPRAPVGAGDVGVCGEFLVEACACGCVFFWLCCGRCWDVGAAAAAAAAGTPLRVVDRAPLILGVEEEFGVLAVEEDGLLSLFVVVVVVVSVAVFEFLVESVLFVVFSVEIQFVYRGRPDEETSWLTGMRMEMKASSGNSGPTMVDGR